MTGFGNAFAGVFPDICAHCGKDLPFRGNRRVPIPSQGGRRRLVHAACAADLERQQTLDVKGAA